MSDATWVPLEAAVKILNSKKPERGEEWEHSYSSRWLNQAGLVGVRFMGSPVSYWNGETVGEFSLIPRTYFLRSRAFYGAVGIGAIGWGQIGPRDLDAGKNGFEDVSLLREKEHYEAHQLGQADPDWEGVFVSRGDFKLYFGFDAQEDGQGLLPLSDDWLSFPPEPAPRERALYPIHKLASMELPQKRIPPTLSMPKPMTTKLSERWEIVKTWDETKRIQAGISPDFRGVTYASVKRWLGLAGH